MTGKTNLFSWVEISDGRTMVLSKRLHRVLEALQARGAHGVSPWDFGKGFRLAAYVHRLRHDYGLDIQTKLEVGQEGRLATYVLASAVRPVSETNGDHEPRA